MSHLHRIVRNTTGPCSSLGCEVRQRRCWLLRSRFVLEHDHHSGHSQSAPYETAFLNVADYSQCYRTNGQPPLSYTELLAAVAGWRLRRRYRSEHSSSIACPPAHRVKTPTATSSVTRRAMATLTTFPTVLSRSLPFQQACLACAKVGYFFQTTRPSVLILCLRLAAASIQISASQTPS